MAPCIQRFLDDGFFYPPKTKTQEGLTQARSIADKWANYISLPVKLIHAWRSLDIEKDETNPRELRVFKREGIIRKQCYSIWRSSGRNHRQLDEIMHDLMKRHNIMKYRPTRQELFNQQKQADTGANAATPRTVTQPLMPAAAATSASPSINPAGPQQPQDDQRKIIIVHAPAQVVGDPSSSANHAAQLAQHQQQLLQQQQPSTSRRNIVCSPVMPPGTDTSTLFPLPPTKVHQPHIALETWKILC